MAVTPTTLGPAQADPAGNLTAIVFTTAAVIPTNSTAFGIVWTRDSLAGNVALVSGVTSIGGVTWGIDGSHVGPSSGGVSLFSAQNTGADIPVGTAVTAALSSNQHRTKMMMWYAPGLMSVDASLSTSGNSASPFTPVSTALTGTGDLVIGAIAKFPNGTDVASAVANWTELSDDVIGATSFLHSIAAWYSSGAVGDTPIYNPTTTISSNYTSLIVGYKFAGVSAPSNLTAPTEVGTAQVGQVLTSDGGTWSNGGDAGMTLAYQWQNFTGSAWVSAIGSGATTLSYTCDPYRRWVTR